MEFKLKEVRKSRNIKAVDLAKKLGITKTTLSGWENNKRLFSVENLIKIADILNASTDELLGRNIVSSGTADIAITKNIKSFDNKPVYSQRYGWVLLNVERQVAVNSKNEEIPFSQLNDISIPIKICI